MDEAFSLDDWGDQRSVGLIRPKKKATNLGEVCGLLESRGAPSMDGLYLPDPERVRTVHRLGFLTFGFASRRAFPPFRAVAGTLQNSVIQRSQEKAPSIY